jgi:hypothetical protein
VLSTKLTAVTETKWGLGLHKIEDLPPADVYNFGLVSHRSIMAVGSETNWTRSSNTWALHCQYPGDSGRSGSGGGKGYPRLTVSCSYITSILGFKLALLFSYRRFVPIGAYRITLSTVIAACILFHMAFLLVQINLCQPARKQWDPAITYGTCIPGVPFYTSMASITIVFDITVFVFPTPGQDPC